MVLRNGVFIDHLIEVLEHSRQMTFLQGFARSADVARGSARLLLLNTFLDRV